LRIPKSRGYPNSLLANLLGARAGAHSSSPKTNAIPPSVNAAGEAPALFAFDNR
jgi:hypothetical protein